MSRRRKIPCLTGSSFVQQTLRVVRKTWPRAAYRLSVLLLREHYDRLGLERGKLALTFDCDYSADSVAADEICRLLNQYKIKSSWAVIGALVKNAPSVYQKLANSGHELLNHTLTHPNNEVLRPDDSRNFARILPAERREEITRCHELVRNLLGYEMKGFRAPHFSMTTDVYQMLADCGYSYSSSRLYYLDPFVGGVHFTKEGVVELPLLAAPVAPFLVPATYFIYRAPTRLYTSEADFYQQFKALLEITSKERLATVIYFDPCDVVRFTKPVFEDYLKTALHSGLELCRMDEIASWLRERCEIEKR